MPGEPTLVRVMFLAHAEGTELVLTHERFAVEAVRDMHLMGWDGCIDKLELYLGELTWHHWPALCGTPCSARHAATLSGDMRQGWTIV